MLYFHIYCLDNEAVEGYSGSVEDGQVQISDVHERMLMYTFFDGNKEALTWDTSQPRYFPRKE